MLKKIAYRYDRTNSFLETYIYDSWFENEESPDATRKSGKEESADLSDLPEREGDKEVKKRIRLKILIPNKLLTRPTILLAQMKVGKKS